MPSLYSFTIYALIGFVSGLCVILGIVKHYITIMKNEKLSLLNARSWRYTTIVATYKMEV